MKAYGYTRKAKEECKYGCCFGGDAGKHVKARKQNDAPRRKAARRITQKFFTDLLE